jgi:predicted ATPase/DNA-binding winged helix-turn-helix (wHTH) protein
VPSSQNSQSGEVFAFGPFELSPDERSLTMGSQPIVLGSRALDILVALVQRAPEVVSQRELISRAWPDLVVEDGSLRVHMTRLRKVLGCGQNGVQYIANVPGRGYSFVKPIQRVTVVPAQPITRPQAPAGPGLHLPSRPNGMIGRDEVVAEVRRLLLSQRFVSLIGPGGIGKTTVAVSVAYALQEEFPEAVCFVDLASVAKGELITSAVAAAAGAAQIEGTLAGLLAGLSSRRLVLVLDNCEHVIEATAEFATRLHREAPQVHLLTTSREALRVSDEHIYLLKSLATPPSGQLTAPEALAWPAVRLFMDRAAMSGYPEALRDEEAVTVAELCRRLDSMPLAIELAASRVGTYGLAGTADLLRNRFTLLWRGSRSAVPRHQTLTAMLDWSYNLLSEIEARVIRSLAVFAGVFTAESAIFVAGHTNLPADEIALAISSLIDKSLISTVLIGQTPYLRLLETSRNYSRSKLIDAGELNSASACHARYYVNFVAGFEDGPSTDLQAFAMHIGNIQAALEWSFSATGQEALGVELAASSVALFLALSRLGECRRWVRKALEALPDSGRGSKRELVLQEALASSSHFTRGDTLEVNNAIERGLELATRHADRSRELNLLSSRYFSLSKLGDFGDAFDVSERYKAIAERYFGDREILLADWMMGMALNFKGDQADAERVLRPAFARVAAIEATTVENFGYAHRIRALASWARVLWLRGFPVRARQIAKQVIEESERHDHPVNLCQALVQVLPICMWLGDNHVVEPLVTRLIEVARANELRGQQAAGLALQGEWIVKYGEARRGVETLRAALRAMHETQFLIYEMATTSALAVGLADCNEHDAALGVIDAALLRAEKKGGNFRVPELYRIRGEILLTSCALETSEAEDSLLKSLTCAQEQGAFAWQLRSASSLARLWQSRQRPDQAISVLEEALSKFSEGFETPDLRAAADLHHALRGTHQY